MTKKPNFRRFVDEPGFTVDVHSSITDADARRILKKLEKEFAGKKPWVGSYTTNFPLSVEGKETLVVLKMSARQTVSIRMGKAAKAWVPPTPKLPRRAMDPNFFLLLGTKKDLLRGRRPKTSNVPLLPKPRRPSRKRS